MPLWNWRKRADFGLHWDGLDTSSAEIFLNSGIGNGANRRTIDRDSLGRIEAWLMDLPPAPYPFPVDAALAARGKSVFEAACAACHAFGGDKTGTPIPIDRLGTDRRRLESWTVAAARGFNALDRYAWRYRSFRKTGGYVAVALDGIWPRAPYLHNGSVPTLWDLLAPPERRPQRFHRGHIEFDPKQVVFVSDARAAAAGGRLFDTTLPGNGNHGHEYGTDLPEPSKWALIEYLKTQ
ncbi:MAG: c-type cytochrome [Alphaproteobacteria bacterium]|nr:c-type cytochrome [Alphaproteobacteria bacterium]